MGALEPGRLNVKTSSAASYELCDLGQVPYPLWASLSSAVKWE